MGAITGSIIIASSSLASAGLQAWFNNEGMKQNLKEHRRSEALNIKFAAEENKRQESRFTRELGLNKEQLAFQKGNAVVQQSQKQMDNLMAMMNNNRNLSSQLISNLRGRK